MNRIKIFIIKFITLPPPVITSRLVADKPTTIFLCTRPIKIKNGTKPSTTRANFQPKTSAKITVMAIVDKALSAWPS